MKINHQLSIATLLMAGVFVTGCSQQQVAGGSQQQIEDVTPVVAAPVTAPEPVRMVKEPVKMEKPADPWFHNHPEAPACAKTKSHSHRYNKNGAPHHHNYGCLRPVMQKPQASEVDVRALQLKLQAKGYYKGPIDGVVGPETRTALQRFMKR